MAIETKNDLQEEACPRMDRRKELGVYSKTIVVQSDTGGWSKDIFNS